MGKYISDFTAKKALLPEKSGGKAAGLARLQRMGVKVPPGFILFAQVFDDFVPHENLHAAIQNSSDSTDFHFPARLEKQILNAWRKLNGPVAVRSSMVGEDGLHHSFAGQLDSFLNLTDEVQVLHAVKKCYASLLNQRLKIYQAQQKIAPKFSMAVIIQKMVSARAGGVAFSADPRTGQCCVIVEAVSGVGDRVASGQITPERYVVDNRGVLIESHLLDPAQPILMPEQILHLAEQVRKIARRLGQPQDIEWAWDGSDFFFLQTRPITSLAGKHIYSSKMVRDMSPGLVKPLLWSTNTLAMMENVFKRIFSELIGKNEVDFRQFLRRFRSRIYADMTLFGELLTQIGLPANFFEIITREELVSHHPPMNWRLFRSLLRALRFVWRYSRISAKMTPFIRLHHAQLEHFRQARWKQAPTQILVEKLDHLLKLHGETQWHIFMNALNMAIRNRLLNRMVEKHVPDVTPADLLQGLSGLKALEPNRMIQEMGKMARKLNLTVLEHLPPNEIRKLLGADATGRDLLAQVDIFTERFGFLSANGTDFSGIPWIENPALIWHAIILAAKNPRNLAPADNQTLRERARKQVAANLNFLRRNIFRRLLNQTIQYIQLREQVSLLMSEDNYQLRRLFLALAARFRRSGFLRAPDDIFYLFYDEVRLMTEGALKPPELTNRIQKRREEMRRDAEIELEETLCGEELLLTEVSPDNLPYLAGIGGSSGIAEGFARIVRDPADIPDPINSSDILIVPFTDVGWTPLFPGISGIVAETGGLLSHTSIIAREYNLPAVVSVKNATRIIHDGQPITIDGRNGRIYLKHLNKTQGA